MEPPRNPIRPFSSSSKEKDTMSNSSSSGIGQGQSQSQSQKRKLPTAQELIAHYESQGLDTKEASLKVIDDLQKAIFVRFTTSSSRGSKNDPKNMMVETSRKLDVINTRLVNLDLKLDSKPGYTETFAIGVASGATLRGIGSLFPHVAGAFANMWNAVRSATSTSPPPPTPH